MKNFLSITFLCGAMLLSFVNVKAQITVAAVNNADSLVQLLLGTGNTIQTSNATLTCSPNASGTFDGTATNLGIGGGILLTSGSVFNALGPNDSQSTSTNNGGTVWSDPDLALITPNPINDACILEFDMLIPGDTVRFNYVFASEEYNDFVNSSVNDAFGFFISGPGINGPYSNNAINIALIPGTSTPISINDVNCGSNGAYYVCNDPWTQFGGGCTDECPTDNSATTVEYDGFTTVLTAQTVVLPCNTYHLKLAISDAGDGIYDSGVFLEAGSLQSNAVNIQLTSLYNDPTGNPAAVEGCSFNPEFVIRLNQYTLIGDSIINTGAQDTACFLVTVSGTATEGIDYDVLPDTICFYPGDTVLTLSINVIDDNISEGIETLVITLTPLDTALNACGTNGDSSVILIYDFPIVVAYPDTTVCSGQPIHLYTNSAPNLTWSPTTDLACPTCMSNIIHPTNDISYIATAQIGSCAASDTVHITVIPAPIADAGNPVVLCYGDTLHLISSGDSCKWMSQFNGTFNVCDTSIVPFYTENYVLTVIDPVNGCKDKDTLIVTVTSAPFVNAGADQTICSGTSVQLFTFLDPALNITWTPANSLDDATVPDPNASPLDTTIYVVTATAGSCSATDSVTINVISVTANAGPDITVCIGTAGQLNGSSSATGASYSWTPADMVTNPADPSTMTTNLIQNTTYTLTVSGTYATSSGQLTCSASDQVVVTVNPLPNAGAGNDTAICLNQSATLNAFGGVNYVWTPSTGGGPNPVVSPTVTTTYTVVVSDAIGCSGTDEVVVTIYPLPVVTASPDDAICPYESTTISASSTPSSVTYAWAPSDGLNSTDQQSTNAQPSATTTYTVTVVDNNGCTGNDQTILTVNPNQPLDAQPSFIVYHLNAIDPLTLSVNSSYTNYFWTPADGLSDGFTQPVNNTLSTTSSTLTANPSESHVYTVVATNSFGCTAIDSVIIDVVDDAVLFVPNAFSPDNGDDYNDVFRIRYEGTFALDLFAVYDRWGKQVWSTTKNGLVNGFTDGWDGTINGQPAEIGSYSYVIRGHDPSGRQHAKQGNVTLIR